MAKRFYSRRELLRAAGGGMGSLALADLLLRDQAQAATGGAGNTLASRKPHFPGEAKSAISIFCYGGVRHRGHVEPQPRA